MGVTRHRGFRCGGQASPLVQERLAARAKVPGGGSGLFQTETAIHDPRRDYLLKGAFNTVFTPPTGQPSSFDGTVVLTRIKF
jgi:hypothetical protein